MAWVASFFIQQPWNALLVAAAFMGLYLWRRSRLAGLPHGHASPWPLAAAIAWAAYAGWEWLVLVRTPDANIRVDLLVIYPMLALLSAWALYRGLRQSPG
ncbi:hypothetical protein [Ottowia sp.]|uniref:hypothetical protein n=1 Tax=Ottowia sp. TaxID=1898956 RepID=UPI002618811A|nr:hypothetical protein [Ottowia sp.]